MKTLASACLIALAMIVPTHADLHITEFMELNGGSLKDEDGDASDWIELFNSGPDSVDLEGYFLTDDEAALPKWSLPALQLDRDSFLLVFASEKNRSVVGSELHTNFKLADGDYLALVDPDGTTVIAEFGSSADPLPPQFEDVSYGLRQNGNRTPLVLIDATPSGTAHVPADATLGETWQALAFDDAEWTPVTSAVGYDEATTYDSHFGAGGDLDNTINNVNTTLYLRFPFSVSESGSISELTLKMKYDDGFAAFLNGVRVADANAPGALSWNSDASAQHSDGEAQGLVDFDISLHAHLLVNGPNLLAIHGLNDSITSSDMLISPELHAVQVTDPSIGSSGFLGRPSPGGLNGDTFGGWDLTWTTTGGKVTITDCKTAASGELVIPDTIEGNPVTSIGDYSFLDCTSLTSITIPDGVTSIGEGAFGRCSSLTSITIPESVTSIEDYAFLDCTSLTSLLVDTGNPNYISVDGVLFNKSMTSLLVYPTGKAGTYTIPDGVTRIGAWAFGNCATLAGVTIPDSVTSIGEAAFLGCNSLTSITIPDSVTGIGAWAFGRCSSLTSITIPDSVTSIGNYAFWLCSSLTSITIPDSVTSIGIQAFQKCTSLTSITIPDSVTSIGDYAFLNCTSLTSITFLGTAPTVGADAFTGMADGAVAIILGEKHASFGDIGTDWNRLTLNCSIDGPLCWLTWTTTDEKVTITDCNESATGELVIPDTIGGNPVTSIGTQAFGSCASLTSITIPDGVTSIGEGAFLDCTSLTSLLVDTGHPNYISVDGVLFNKSMTSLLVYPAGKAGTYTIPDGVTSIGDYAFGSCTSLTSITIPDSVTSIGAEAFYRCSNLTSITIPDSVTSIGEGAFLECTNLASLLVDTGNPNYISVDGVLFNKSMTSLLVYPAGKAGTYTIPDGVTSLGIQAFQKCTSLTSITIPDSVTSIGDYAFLNCTSLTSITFLGTAPTVGAGAFTGMADGAVAIILGEKHASFGDIGTDWNRLTLNCSIDGPLCWLTWTTTDGKVTITDCNEAATGELVIPDTIGGNPVTSIGTQAFGSCTSLTSITIPDGVTSIGEGAFLDCTSLTSLLVDTGHPNYISVDGVLFNKSMTSLLVYPAGKAGTYTIPNSVTSIGDYAFGSCTSLTSITIPDSVTSIGEGAFLECTNLTSLLVDTGNPNYISVDGVLFNKSMTSLLVYPAGKSGTYTIPDGVTSIGEGAFGRCSSLTSITIPDSVTSIGEGAFLNCTSLTSITFLGTAPTVGAGAFTGMADGAVAIILGEKHASFGDIGTDWNRLTLNCSIDGPLCWLTWTTTDGKVTVTDCNEAATGELVIPDTIGGNPVTSIGTQAFGSCASLTSITIPDGVTSIGEGAFLDCTSLTSITFLGTAPTVETFAFSGVADGAVALVTIEALSSFGGFGTDWNGLTVSMSDSYLNDLLAQVTELSQRPTAEQLATVEAERNARFVDNDKDGITDVKETELETDSTEETTFYLQDVYDSAVDASRVAGQGDVTADPATFDLTPLAAYNGMVAQKDITITTLNTTVAEKNVLIVRKDNQHHELEEQSVAEAQQLNGIIETRNNTISLNTTTIASLNETITQKEAAYVTVVAERDARPTAEQLATVEAERNARFVDNDKDGITDVKETELETDSTEETTFYLQDVYDSAVDASRVAGQGDVTADPATFDLTPLAAYNGMVAQKDITITTLNTTVAEKNVLIVRKDNQHHELEEQSVAEAQQLNGIIETRNNTISLNTTTIASLNETITQKEAAYVTVVAERDARPTAEQLATVEAERNARFVDNDKDGITDVKETELETDSTEETTFYLQDVYDSAVDASRVAGQGEVTADPATFDLTPLATYNGMVAQKDITITTLNTTVAEKNVLIVQKDNQHHELEEQSVAEAQQLNGIIETRNNTISLNTTTIASLAETISSNTTTIASLAETITQKEAAYVTVVAERDARPTAEQLATVEAERNARFVDNDKDGITDVKETELETDSTEETTFYLQDVYDSAVDASRVAGQGDVTADPATFDLTPLAAYNGMVAQKDITITTLNTTVAEKNVLIVQKDNQHHELEEQSVAEAQQLNGIIETRNNTISLNTTTIASLNETITQKEAAYVTVVAERDARPTLAAYNTAVAESRVAGQGEVTSAPSSYNLTTSESYNAVVAERDAAIAERDARPTAEQFATVEAERNARFVDNDKDGITDAKETELETDSTEETTFYLQDAYDSAVDASRVAGQGEVTADPATFDLTPLATYNGMVAQKDITITTLNTTVAEKNVLIVQKDNQHHELEEQSVAEAQQLNGIIETRNNTISLNTTTIASLAETISSNTTTIASLAETITQKEAAYVTVVAERDARPTAEQLATVEAERNARFVDNDKDGITDVKETELETDSTEETTFYLQDVYDSAVDASRVAGQGDVTADPATFDLTPLAAYNGMVAQKDITITTLNTTVAEKNVLIVQKDNQHHELEEQSVAEAQQLNGIIETRNNTISLNTTTIASLNETITQKEAAYVTVVAERDARPTQASYDVVEEERDARFTEDQIHAMSADSTIGMNDAGNVEMKINFFESADLVTFAPFTVAPESVSVVDGNICLEFTPKYAAFFQLSLR